MNAYLFEFLPSTKHPYSTYIVHNGEFFKTKCDPVTPRLMVPCTIPYEDQGKFRARLVFRGSSEVAWNLFDLLEAGKYRPVDAYKAFRSVKGQINVAVAAADLQRENEKMSAARKRAASRKALKSRKATKKEPEELVAKLLKKTGCNVTNYADDRKNRLEKWNQKRGTSLSPAALIVLLLLGFAASLALAGTIGANDVANTFGSSVGAGAITLYQAFTYASIFESAGACLLGLHEVTETLRKGVVDMDLFEGRQKELFFAQISVLAGTGTFLFIATMMKKPVSTTHAIIGSIIGACFFVTGWSGIRWEKLAVIVVTGNELPLWAAITAALFFGIAAFLVVFFSEVPRVELEIRCEMQSDTAENQPLVEPLAPLAVIDELEDLEVWEADQSSSNCFIRAFRFSRAKIQSLKRFCRTKILQFYRFCLAKVFSSLRWMSEIISNSMPAKVIASMFMFFYDSKLVMRIRTALDWFFHSERGEDRHATKLFANLQVVTSCFLGFAHGGNDISNAIAPFVSMLVICNGGVNQQTPLWVLAFGALGMSVGLWMYGARVIKTVGSDIIEMTPARGFAIEVGASTAVLIASKMGLPISSTVCKLGSIVAMGHVHSPEGLKWSVFGGIICTWVITIPACALISYAYMLAFRLLFF